MNIEKLSDAVARHIFEVGSDPGREVTRIEFKAKGNLVELSMGGLCEKSLSSVITEVLLKYNIANLTDKELQ